MKKFLCLIALSVCFLYSYANTNPDDILGRWANRSNKGHIVIFKEQGKYYGKIVWLSQPNDKDGRAKTDKNNPSINARPKPLLGLVMLKDFKYNNGEWTGGKIYNPNDGKEYKAYMELKDKKTLSVRGYIGFSWLGKTELFHRVQ